MDFGLDGVFSALPPQSGGGGGGGRVAGVGAGTGSVAAFQIFSSDDGGRSGGFVADSLSRVWDASASASATDLFMSDVNVEALHAAIRYRVHVETGGRHVIGRQSDAELALVMRSVLLQSGRNDASTSAVEQVRDLNAEVLAWCVPRIVTELRQYLRYREDVATLPVPLPHGPLATNKGSRQIELRPFF